MPRKSKKDAKAHPALTSEDVKRLEDKTAKAIKAINRITKNLSQCK